MRNLPDFTRPAEKSQPLVFHALALTTGDGSALVQFIPIQERQFTAHRSTSAPLVASCCPLRYALLSFPLRAQDTHHQHIRAFPIT